MAGGGRSAWSPPPDSSARRRAPMPRRRLSVFLMVVGYLMLALVCASFAAVFVRDEERPRDAREELTEHAIVTSLTSLEARLTSLESQLIDRAAGVVPVSVDEADPPSGTESIH